MSPREALLLVYGLIFGTSTPYLKPKNRFLFPTSFIAGPEGLEFFLGGSGVCAALREGGQTFVVNLNRGDSAEAWRRILHQRREVAPVAAVALSSLNGNFGDSVSIARLGDVPVYVPPLREVEAESLSAVQTVEVRDEKVISFGEERIHLVPVLGAASGSDLVVFFERRSVLHLGALFFNRVHPVLQIGAAAHVETWIHQLEALIARFSPQIVVAAEGGIGTVEDVREFVRYLKSLTDSTVEFSFCRQHFDWMEIPSASSLEENFDILRRNVKTHTSLN